MATRDPEALHLLGEGLAHRLQGVLDGGVVAMPCDGQPTRDGGDVHDGAAAAFAHARQHGSDHLHDPEIVRLEQRLHPLDRHVLDRLAAADACVVDEDVNSTRHVEHLGHPALDRTGVIHVEGDHPDRQALLVDCFAELGGRGRVADAGPDVVTVAAKVQGGRETDAGARASDQCDGHVFLLRAGDGSADARTSSVHDGNPAFRNPSTSRSASD